MGNCPLLLWEGSGLSEAGSYVDLWCFHWDQDQLWKEKEYSPHLPPWPLECNKLFGILNVIMEEVIGFFISSAFCIHLFDTVC